MKPAVNIDNRIFLYALIGVVLLIGAIGFIVANMADAATFRLSYPLAGVLGIPSLSLLYAAFKKDRYRFRN